MTPRRTTWTSLLSWGGSNRLICKLTRNRFKNRQAQIGCFIMIIQLITPIPLAQARGIIKKPADPAAIEGRFPREDLSTDQAAKIQSFIDHHSSSQCHLLPHLAKSALLQPLAAGQLIDYLLVDKSRRLVHALSGTQLVRTYRAAFGPNPHGPKTEEGDGKTPEGIYFLTFKNNRSDYHLSMKISYPNQRDLENSSRNHTSTGSDIMVHGLPSNSFKRLFINHPKQNWTRGCVAVSDREIEELYTATPIGTLIEICPN